LIYSQNRTISMFGLGIHLAVMGWSGMHSSDVFSGVLLSATGLSKRYEECIDD